MLLIIFMITASISVESAAHVGLPLAENTSPEKRGVVVTYTIDHEIFVNSKDIPSSELEPTLREALARIDPKIVIFQGDRKVLLGDMVKILNVAKAAGADQIAIAAKRASVEELETLAALVRRGSSEKSAMAIPSSNDSGIFGEINITPLTDIFLVLLIIFMVGAAVAIESAAHVGLPQAKPAAANQPPDNVIVELTSERRILVDQHEVGLNDLERGAAKALDKSHGKIVIFKGDPKIILGDMVIVLDIAKRAGAQQLGVGVSEADSGRETRPLSTFPRTTP